MKERRANIMKKNIFKLQVMKCLISTDDVINAKLSANCEPNNHSLTPVSAAPLGRFWQRQDSIPSATAAWRRARPNTMISYKFHTILFYSSGSSPFLSHTLCMQVCVCVLHAPVVSDIICSFCKMRFHFYIQCFIICFGFQPLMWQQGHILIRSLPDSLTRCLWKHVTTRLIICRCKRDARYLISCSN